MADQMRVEEVALLALTIVVPLVALFIVLDTVRAQLFGAEQPAVDAEQQRRDADDLRQLADRLRQRRHARPQQQQQQGNAGVNQDCVICLQELGGGQPPRLVVELIPCSHELHSDCATELVQSPAFARSGALCPTCRARTLLFVPSFERHPNHADAIAALPPPLREFNRRGGVPTFAAGWSALNYAVTHFRQLPWRAQARLLLLLFVALSYIISPFDLLSEAEFGLLGFADDVVVFLASSALVFVVLRAVFI